MPITTHPIRPWKASSYQTFGKKPECNVVIVKESKCDGNNDNNNNISCVEKQNYNSYNKENLIKTSDKDSEQRKKIDRYCELIIMDIVKYYNCKDYKIYFDENKEDIETMIDLLLGKLHELEKFGKNEQMLKLLSISIVSLVVKFIMDDYPDVVKMYKKNHPGIMEMEIYILKYIDFKLLNIWEESQKKINV